MYCPRCGTDAAKGQMLCSRCGYQFGGGNTPVQQGFQPQMQPFLTGMPPVPPKRPFYKRGWFLFCMGLISGVTLFALFGIVLSYVNDENDSILYSEPYVPAAEIEKAAPVEESSDYYGDVADTTLGITHMDFIEAVNRLIAEYSVVPLVPPPDLSEHFGISNFGDDYRLSFGFLESNSELVYVTFGCPYDVDNPDGWSIMIAVIQTLDASIGTEDALEMIAADDIIRKNDVVYTVHYSDEGMVLLHVMPMAQ